METNKKEITGCKGVFGVLGMAIALIVGIVLICKLLTWIVSLFV